MTNKEMKCIAYNTSLYMGWVISNCLIDISILISAFVLMQLSRQNEYYTSIAGLVFTIALVVVIIFKRNTKLIEAILAEEDKPVKEGVKKIEKELKILDFVKFAIYIVIWGMFFLGINL